MEIQALIFPSVPEGPCLPPTSGYFRSEAAVPTPRHFFGKPALMAARKMYPERCISMSDSSGSTSIEAL